MRRRLKQVAVVAIAIVASVGALSLNNFVSAIVPGINERISIRSTGAQASNSSNSALLSANGKVAVFYSSATNILPSGGKGIFKRTLAAGNIERVNVSSAGAIDNGSTSVPNAISATGRYILFNSNATNLVDGVTTPANGALLYMRDTLTSTTTLISQTAAGTISNGTNVTSTQNVSSDGRFVLFASNATNLHPDATDSKTHVYLLDRSDNSFSIIDRKTDGTVSQLWAHASMSCDGSLVVFDSAQNLIVGDTYSNHVDVYLLDRRGVTDKLTNLTKFANSAVMSPSTSCNGDYIGFESLATNIDPSITVTSVYNGYRPYIYDRVNGIYHFAAVTNSGAATTATTCGTVGGGTPCIQISNTGVGAFATNDSTLTGDPGQQVYLRDIYAGVTEIVSKSSSGIPGNGYSGDPTISADGTIVYYQSTSTNLVTGDTNGNTDTFTSLTGY